MIGLFDSGIGGLTVLRELQRVLPDAPFIYLGDTARTPYGNKSAETVTRYAIEDATFLLNHGATAIVIACNSASAVATEALKKQFPSVPIFDVITPTVEDATLVTKGRVGIIGTRATIASKAYQDRLTGEVLAQACPLFVPLVEEGWLEDGETKRIVRRYLSPLRSANVDTLIMGCTHYPLLRPLIERYMGKRVHLVDPAVSVTQRLVSQREALFANSSAEGQRYFLTDVSPQSDKIAQQWLGRPVQFEKATLG